MVWFQVQKLMTVISPNNMKMAVIPEVWFREATVGPGTKPQE